MAISTATQEAVWLRRLLEDLQALPEGPTTIKTLFNMQEQNIEIKYHYVCEALQKRIITLSYCPTNKRIADLLTKRLPRGRFEMLHKAMGMDIC